MYRSFAIVVALIGSLWMTGTAAAQFPPCAPQAACAAAVAVQSHQLQQAIARPMLAAPTLTPTIKVVPAAPVARPAAIAAPARPATAVAAPGAAYRR